MRDKQIEEMVKIIDGYCEAECLDGCYNCAPYKNAEQLYNAGYRKASDVAREIFGDIYRALNYYKPYRELNNIVYNVFGILEEVEKKYESEEK